MQRAGINAWWTMIDTNCTGLVRVRSRFMSSEIAPGRKHPRKIFGLADANSAGDITGDVPEPRMNVWGSQTPHADMRSRAHVVTQRLTRRMSREIDVACIFEYSEE